VSDLCSVLEERLLAQILCSRLDRAFLSTSARGEPRIERPTSVAGVLAALKDLQPDPQGVQLALSAVCNSFHSSPSACHTAVCQAYTRHRTEPPAGTAVREILWVYGPEWASELRRRLDDKERQGAPLSFGILCTCVSKLTSDLEAKQQWQAQRKMSAVPDAAAAQPRGAHQWKQRQPGKQRQQRLEPDVVDSDQQQRQFDMEGDLGPPVGPSADAAQVRVLPMVRGASTRKVLPQLSTAGRLGSSLGGVSWFSSSGGLGSTQQRQGSASSVPGSRRRRILMAQAGLLGHSSATSADTATVQAQQQAHTLATQQWQGLAAADPGQVSSSTSGTAAGMAAQDSTAGITPTSTSAAVEGGSGGAASVPSPATATQGGATSSTSVGGVPGVSAVSAAALSGSSSGSAAADSELSSFSSSRLAQELRALHGEAGGFADALTHILGSLPDYCCTSCGSECTHC